MQVGPLSPQPGLLVRGGVPRRWVAATGGASEEVVWRAGRRVGGCGRHTGGSGMAGSGRAGSQWCSKETGPSG